MNLSSQSNGDLMETHKMIAMLIARLGSNRLTAQFLCYIQRQVLTEIKLRGLAVIPVEVKFYFDLSGSAPAPAPAQPEQVADHHNHLCTIQPVPVSGDAFADFIAMLDLDDLGDQDSEAD